MATKIYTSKAELQRVVQEAIQKLDKKQFDRLVGQKSFTVNQVAKRLGKAHATIKKMISAGHISTTKDGLITEEAIKEYLKGRK